MVVFSKHVQIIKTKLMSVKTLPYVPYKVKDMSLAEWGRKEIELAEAEMPGPVSYTHLTLPTILLV